MIDLRFVYEIGVDLDHLEDEWIDEDTDTYVGNDWKDCCEQSARDCDYDKSGFPTNEDGTIGYSRKDLVKILQESEEGEWGEVSQEVYGYYEERKNYEMNLETSRKIQEQLFGKN